MLVILSNWLLVAAFAGAGLFNAIGTPATQDSFVRWGYPKWWCRVTGALEIVVAALIPIPATHAVGLVLGAAIIGAAMFTVLHHREWTHLAPVGVSAALIALVAAVS
jgi:hypothetical protein